MYIDVFGILMKEIFDKCKEIFGGEIIIVFICCELFLFGIVLRYFMCVWKVLGFFFEGDLFIFYELCSLFVRFYEK